MKASPLEARDIVPPELIQIQRHSEGQTFGSALDAYGATLVVGDPDADRTNDRHPGAVYVFVRQSTNQWSQQARLVISDGQRVSFGRRVSVSGNTLVATSGGDYPAAHVFVRNGTTWTRQAVLMPGMFFNDVAIDGDRLVLLSRNAYAFRRVNGVWTRQATLYPDPGSPYFAVASMGDGMLVLGAPGELGTGPRGPGIAYVYARHTAQGQPDRWMREAKLSPIGGLGDLFTFGMSVGVARNRVVVGSPWEGNSSGGEFAGAAYVFTKLSNGEWSQTARLTSPSGEERRQFGRAVAIHYDAIAVSEVSVPSSSVEHQSDRAIDVYVRSAGAELWSLRDRLKPGYGRVPEPIAMSNCGVYFGVPGQTHGPEDSNLVFLHPSLVCESPIAR